MGKLIRTPWMVFGLSVLVLGGLVALCFVGVEPIPLDRLFVPGSVASQIFWSLRVPRVLAGILTGAVLAVSGLVFQAVFQNSLASPFTLGTASGASLGASLYIWAGWSFSLFGLSGITLFAFLGALAALGLVYAFSRAQYGMARETMLLSGVATSIIFSSLILFLQYFSNQAHSLRILRWLMGGLDVVGYQQVLEPCLPALAGIAVAVLFRSELNLFAAGEDLARGRGLDVNRVKLVLLLFTGLMVGAVVSVAGPVGFVGLMVPHIARQMLGSDHRTLVPATLLLGAIFLPACDALARVLLAPAELPVGIITALLGGPFFIWILLTRRRTA